MDLLGIEYVGNQLPTFDPPNSIDPSSIIVDNGSALPATSVGDTVHPSPFYLNNILVAPASLFLTIRSR
jgi:hypothetical protein